MTNGVSPHYGSLSASCEATEQKSFCPSGLSLASNFYSFQVLSTSIRLALAPILQTRVLKKKLRFLVAKIFVVVNSAGSADQAKRQFNRLLGHAGTSYIIGINYHPSCFKKRNETFILCDILEKNDLVNPLKWTRTSPEVFGSSPPPH